MDQFSQLPTQYIRNLKSVQLQDNPLQDLLVRLQESNIKEQVGQIKLQVGKLLVQDHYQNLQSSKERQMRSIKINKGL